jgi:hypothetical protein
MPAGAKPWSALDSVARHHEMVVVRFRQGFGAASECAWAWARRIVRRLRREAARQGQRPSREARKRVGVGPHAQ